MSNLREGSLLLESALFLQRFAKACEAAESSTQANRARYLADELKKLAQGKSEKP